MFRAALKFVTQNTKIREIVKPERLVTTAITSIGVGYLLGTGYGIYCIVTGDKGRTPLGVHPKEVILKDRHRRPRLQEEDLNSPSEKEIKVTDYSKYKPRPPEPGPEPDYNALAGRDGELAAEETPVPRIFVPHENRNTGRFTVVVGGKLRRVYTEDEIPEHQGQDEKKGEDQPSSPPPPLPQQ
ncbi:uncharacterized protein [Periplaneta americana]|uniref:uncharacterized protein n=1 Tax=Periplaneta americana TaxID=6978 RepID=UPI0037E8802D